MLLLSSLVFPGLSSAYVVGNLFVSHYEGKVSSLSLTAAPYATNATNGTYSLSRRDSTYSLSLTESTRGCGYRPSWLTFDPLSDTLFCSNEYYGDGTLTSYLVSPDGRFLDYVRVDTRELSARDEEEDDILVDAPGGAVHNALFGDGYIAQAHYSASAISTFALPLSVCSRTLQEFDYDEYPLGPDPRQDAPHPNQILVDPTGQFMVVPDVGADRLRLFAIRPGGELTPCPSVVLPPATGPRHAAFAYPPFGFVPQEEGTLINETAMAPRYTVLYVANEISNTVSAFSVQYGGLGCCPTLIHQQDITTFSDNMTAPVGTRLAEVHVKGYFLYVSNQNDRSFDPDDSITQFAIFSTGQLLFSRITSSYGSYPRTFDINNAGTRVAIGNRVSSTVVIVPRDVRSGYLGEPLATLQIGPMGTPDGQDGLSSVLWAE